MNFTFKIVLAFLQKILGLTSLFAAIMILFFTDNPENAYIISEKNIFKLFILSLFFVIISNVAFYFRAAIGKGEFLNKVFIAFSIISIFTFSVAAYEVAHIDTYKSEIINQKRDEVIKTISLYESSGNKMTEGDMGLLLGGKHLLQPEYKDELSAIFAANADFAFTADYREVPLFQKYEKKKYLKGTHIINILLSQKDYANLLAVSKNIGNPNYRNPEYLGDLTKDKSIFEDLVNEYLNYEYADLGESIILFLEKGADTNIKDNTGSDLIKLFELRQEKLKTYIQNPDITSGDQNNFLKKISEIDEILLLLRNKNKK